LPSVPIPISLFVSLCSGCLKLSGFLFASSNILFQSTVEPVSSDEFIFPLDAISYIFSPQFYFNKISISLIFFSRNILLNFPSFTVLNFVVFIHKKRK